MNGIRQIVLAFASILPAGAGVVIDNFNDYGSSNLESMAGLNGGTEWQGGWTAATTTTMNPGYFANQTTAFINPGYFAGDNLSGPMHGKMVSVSTDGAGYLLRRTFATGMTGTVWISLLVRHSGNTSGDALFWFESATSGGGANTFVGLRGGDRPTIRYGGEESSAVDLNSAGLNLLFLVRVGIDASGSADSIDFWVKTEADDLSSEAALGTPALSRSGSDLFGTELNWIAISGGSGASSNYDALRISDGPDAFGNVLRPPTPGDRDGDGLTDEQEMLLGLNPDVSDYALVTAIRNHPDYFSLYDKAGILAQHRGGTVFAAAEDGTVPLFFEIQFSRDMTQWLPLTVVRRHILPPEGTAFLRLTADQASTPLQP